MVAIADTRIGVKMSDMIPEATQETVVSSDPPTTRKVEVQPLNLDSSKRNTKRNGTITINTCSTATSQMKSKTANRQVNGE